MEIVWVDASQCEGEDEEPGKLGGLQLLRSIGYLSGVDEDAVVLARNASFMDPSQRGSETIPLVNVVRVYRLEPGLVAEAAKWHRRDWIKALLG